MAWASFVQEESEAHLIGLIRQRAETIEDVDGFHQDEVRRGSAEQVYCLDLAADNAGNTRVLVSGLSNNERRLPQHTVESE